MSAVYKVVIGDSGGQTTFTLMGMVDWRDVERIHRRNLNPNVLVAAIREITFVLTLEADTPAAVVTALGNFLAARVNIRTLPTRFQVQDVATSTPITDIGDLRSVTDGGNWEELQITSFTIENDEPQLKAGATFTLVVRGRRIWKDGNDFAEFDQEFTVSAGTAGLEEQRLVTTCRAEKGVDILDKADLLRLARPAGWVRLGPSNNTDGIEIRYSNYPLLDEAVVTSAVQQLGGGLVLPELAGDGTRIDRVQEDVARGVNVSFLRAEIVGGLSPLGFVEGFKPAGGLGQTQHDRARRRAFGEWETRSAILLLKGRVMRVTVSWTLSNGGRDIDETLILGGFLPKLRRSPVHAFQLVERTEALALGPVNYDQFPLPAPLASPWVHAERLDQHELPIIQDYGGDRTQHIWRSAISRTYWWDAEGDPRANSDNQKVFMQQFLSLGEDGGRTLISLGNS